MSRLPRTILFAIIFVAFFLQSGVANAAWTYTSKFGTSGSGNGQFNSPSHIAISTTGDIYVVDGFNSRVQIFNSGGVYQSQFGSFGTGNGQFKAPFGIAIDSGGDLYVADGNNHRIQKFNSAGVYQSQFGVSGTGNGQFNTPYGIAISTAGDIYVSDNGNDRVQKFNSAGVYQSQFGSTGTGNEQFSSVSGIAIDAGGNIYVVDQGNNRVEIFNSAGVYQSSFGVFGSGNAEFASPTNITISLSTGDIYVSDNNNQRIQIFTSPSTYKGKFGTSGSGNGQFNNPNGMALDSSENIYVVDTQNKRVQKFSNHPVITPSTTDLFVTENDANTYTLTLDTEPSSDVIVTLSTTTPGTGSGVVVSPSILTFTALNWNTPQVVSVAGTNDTQYTGTRSSTISSVVTSSDISFNGLSIPNTIVEIGDDESPPTIVPSIVNLSVGEGAQTSYTLTLDNQPSNDVIVTLSTTTPGTGSGVVISPSIVTFTTLNWNTPKVVNISATDDSNVDGNRLVTITSVVTSSDTNFDSLFVSDVNVDVVEDDMAPTIIPSSVNLSVEENAQTSYTLALNTEPTSDVIVTLSTTTPGIGSGVVVSPSVLTFTSLNWDTPQVVTVSATDDSSIDGDRSVTISSVVTSSDISFDAISVSDVNVDIAEDDIFLIIINNCTELQDMTNDLAANYRLSQDIDCRATGISDPLNPNYDNNLFHGGEGFIPVGTPGAPFIGKINGNNHTISNLTIARPNEDQVGLFGYADGSTFRNLTITGSIEGGAFVGTLVGQTFGAVTIDQIRIESEITAHASRVGGLVGIIAGSGTITNSSVSSIINVSSASFLSQIGGLFGEMDGSGSTIASSTASGIINVTSTGDVVRDIGGLTGDFNGMSITGSTASVNIIVSSFSSPGYIGGLSAYFGNPDGIIGGSTSSGNINITNTGNGSEASYIGGLVGGFDSSTITNSVSSGDVVVDSGDDNVAKIGGFIGSTDVSAITITGSSATGDVTVTTNTFADLGIGGFVGAVLSGGTIDSSLSTGNITVNAGNYIIGGSGGLVGSNSSTLHILNSFSTSDIMLTAGSGQIIGVGGILGFDSVLQATIDSSYSTGDITATAGDFIQYVGGLVGNLAQGNINNSFSVAAISLTSGTSDIRNVAGLIGSYDIGSSFSNNYFDRTLSLQPLCTGIDDPDPVWCTAKTDSSFFKGNTDAPLFSVWNFGTVWSSLFGNYPVLRSLPSPYVIVTPPPPPPAPTPTPGSTSSRSSGGSSGFINLPVQPAPIPLPTPPAIPLTSPLPLESVPTFTQRLSFGSRGNEVMELQITLVSLNFLSVAPTGYFGPLTEAALKAYQRSKGLEPTGVLDPLTIFALNNDKIKMNAQSEASTTIEIPAPINPEPFVVQKPENRSFMSFITPASVIVVTFTTIIIIYIISLII